MKKKEQTTGLSPVVTRYKHEEAEVLITKTVAEINEKVVDEASELADIGKPTSSEKGLKLYTETITRGFQLLLEKVNSLIGADSAKSEGAAFKKESEREEQELTENIHDQQHILRKAKKKLKGMNSRLGNTMRTWRNVMILLIVIALGEWLLNTGAFYLVTGGAWLPSFLSAFTVTAALFAIPHVIDRVIDRIRPIGLKIGIVALFSGLVLILLYALTALRLGFLTDSGQTSIAEHVSKHDFVIINFTMFLTSTLLTIFYRPGKGIVEEHKAFKEQNKKVAELEEALDKNKRILSELPKKRDAKLAEYYALLLMAKNYEQVIEAEHQQSLALWVKTNIIKRKPERDGFTPPILSEPKPMLTTYFHEI